ncbi:TIGR03086 family metal-binding protein [Nonomuraea sp. NPDC002799]
MNLLALDAAALDHVGNLVEGLTEAQLAAATPCAGWTVRDLIDHMNTEHEAISEGLLNAFITLDPDPRRAFPQAAARWRAAFGQPGLLERDIHIPKYGVRYPCRQILSIHLADMLTHHWDISRAIGLDPDLPADLLSVAVPVAQALPAEGALRGPGRTYASPVQVQENASPTDLLVAALGRSPSWRASQEPAARTS